MMGAAFLLIGAGLLISVAVDRVDTTPITRAVRVWRDEQREARRAAAPIRARIAAMRDRTT